MIGALAALVLLGGGSLVVGQALAALSGGATREQPGDVSWLAPAFGLGTLLVVGGVAVRLPGHATTAAIVLAGAVVGAFVYVRGRVRGARAAALLGAPGVVITVLAAALPFAIAGHVGVLGVGLVNDDMASHLIIADYIGDPTGVVPSFIKGGYPIGPHALVAAIGRGTGADLIDVFAGLTLALPALLGLLGLGMLEGLPRYRRILGACLIALSYLGVSYLAQGAFKEPVLSLLVIGFALCLARLIGLERGREAEPDGTASLRVSPLLLGLPLGVLAAAVVFTYSLPGLLWLGAVGAALVLARVLLLEPRPKLPPNWPRKAAPYAIGAVAVVALATVQEWSRIADFSRVSALNPERFGSQLGNLRGSLSPLEVLGIWPSGDFRVTAGDGGLPALVFYAGAALAAAALLLGLSSAWRQRQLTLAAAAVAVGAVWGLLALIGSPY
ncbi:MAG: hypothetical protein H0V25_08940, partial [Solirubrobacterales bacterium]|nr:hypothetical protein [Solirubrobacterales bacterium]